MSDLPDDELPRRGSRVQIPLEARRASARYRGLERPRAGGQQQKFICGTRKLLNRVRFEVEDILSSDGRAVIVGQLAILVNATGKLIVSSFAIIQTIAYGQLTRFQMLEDSFAVSRATRP
jgi:uncharacterized protein